jgi:hypothetical protein
LPVPYVQCLPRTYTGKQKRSILLEGCWGVALNDTPDLTECTYASAAPRHEETLDLVMMASEEMRSRSIIATLY